jgi:hypothetical protein
MVLVGLFGGVFFSKSHLTNQSKILVSETNFMRFRSPDFCLNVISKEAGELNTLDPGSS